MIVELEQTVAGRRCSFTHGREDVGMSLAFCQQRRKLPVKLHLINSTHPAYASLQDHAIGVISASNESKFLPWLVICKLLSLFSLVFWPLLSR